MYFCRIHKGMAYIFHDISNSKQGLGLGLGLGLVYYWHGIHIS